MVGNNYERASVYAHMKLFARILFWLTVQLERNKNFRRTYADLEWNWSVDMAKQLGAQARENAKRQG